MRHAKVAAPAVGGCPARGRRRPLLCVVSIVLRSSSSRMYTTEFLYPMMPRVRGTVSGSGRHGGGTRHPDQKHLPYTVCLRHDQAVTPLLTLLCCRTTRHRCSAPYSPLLINLPGWHRAAARQCRVKRSLTHWSRTTQNHKGEHRGREEELPLHTTPSPCVPPQHSCEAP